MTIQALVGETVNFEWAVPGYVSVVGATVEFAIRKVDGLDNLIESTPTIALNVLSDDLTSAETITLGAGRYIYEFKSALSGVVKKRKGNLTLYSSITD